MPDLTELRELLDNAAARPWRFHGWNPKRQNQNGDWDESILLDGRDEVIAYELPDTSGRLVVAAVNALPELLDAAEALERLKAEPRDEYHTMDELYHYRMLYNALAVNLKPESAVKSWRHSDGELCFGGGWFVVYLELPTGQVSNHYKAEHWDIFQIPEVKTAPEWDGHTPADAASRLLEAARQPQP